MSRMANLVVSATLNPTMHRTTLDVLEVHVWSPLLAIAAIAELIGILSGWTTTKRVDVGPGTYAVFCWRSAPPKPRLPSPPLKSPQPSSAPSHVVAYLLFE
ncbi:non-structural protein 1 [Striga asiatica]|uniref:Non-structural protein 1 n=1 Tax=Striga asiatica TaxID=4170 RepID=A0A5A7P8U6_STRAF|nr:non-structural protein 1 [Striga asiatica]